MPIPSSSPHPRRDLLNVFHSALAAVHGTRSVAAALERRPAPRGPGYVIAIGKAARAMYDGAVLGWGRHLAEGIVITKHGHGGGPAQGDPPMRVYEAGHPLPDEASLRAGEALLRFIADAPADANLLLLISGGASSLVEVLPPGLGLKELRRANDWLLGSGLDIHHVNAVRKALSCIKAGRLARMLGNRQTLQLLMSDVPGDAPAAIGSGLLVPGDGELPPEVPAWLDAWLRLAPAAPAPGEKCFARITTEIVASAAHAREAAAQVARSLGYAVYEHGELVTGDAVERGQDLAQHVLDSPPGLHVWCGETTVRLPPLPGRGGRNQNLALAAALQLAGHENFWLLSAGTDGTDGPTEDAGALVDGGTLERGEQDDLDADHCLARADAGTFLQASGDLIRTGPTGTNVMDLMLGLKLR